MVGSSACFYNSYTTSRNSLAILEQKVRDLKQLLEKIELKFRGNGVLRPDPSEWIRNVNTFLEADRKMDLGGHLHESCINCCLVCKTWKLILNSTRKADKLLKEGEDIEVVGIRRSGSRTTDFFGEDVENISEMIWNEVSQETGVQVVCIHGIAGVGKTVMAAAIHDKALENMEDNFQNVIWISIEYGWVMKDIQEEIGRQLPSDLSDCTDDRVRAERLKAVLTSKKFLLVLDSFPMWQDLNLDHIGLPRSSNSWKLIVASRSYSACIKVRERISATNIIYEIKPLPQDKAWELFEHVAGSNLGRLNDEIIQDTKLAVIDLNGLPSAIEMFAKALKEIPDDNPTRIIDSWKRELVSLSSSGSLLGRKGQEFFNGFKDIFDKLEQVELSCFAYCLLFPKGYIIKAKELIEYWMWEGILGEVSCLEETIGKGREVLHNLSDAHLLEIIDEGKPEESVRMLTVIRFAAMNADVIKSGHHDIIKCGNSVKELPLAKDWPENTQRATFVQNEVCALQNSPDCKFLSTLLMQDNPLDSASHKKFFSKLVNLRVLDLSRTKMKSLPKSLSGLDNLHALLLRDCENLTSLPSLSNLQKLLVLDLSGTPVTELPRGLNNLTNLRRLNLSCTKLQVLQASEVGQLTQLEELLLMCNSGGNLIWGSNKIYSVRRDLCIEEIINLGRLVVLQLNFSDTAVFRKFLHTAKFERNAARQGVTKRRFKFRVGQMYNNCDHVVGDNSLTLIGDHRAPLTKGTAELHLISCAQKLPSLNIYGCLRHLSILDVSDFDYLEYVLTREMLNNLVELKEIRVRRCQKTVSIIKPDAEADIIAVPKLTTLLLCDLPELKSICDWQEVNFPFLEEVKPTEIQPSSTSGLPPVPPVQPINCTGLPPVPPVQTVNRTGHTTPGYLDILRGWVVVTFSRAAGDLHTASTSSYAMSEDSALPLAGAGPSEIELNRSRSSRSTN
ncbi:hypothetical protein SOVF_033540 isoform B [Spinacia oleracea]|nr:hypothetical protein SOVF_033540 isoform B [Spinacia oleracea]